MDPRMSFSELIEGSLVKWAPNAGLIACPQIKEDKLEVRTLAKRLRISQSYSTQALNRIDQVEWSADSGFLALASYTQGLVQLFSIKDPKWKCKIDLGTEAEGTGLLDITWGPKTPDLLTTSAHHV